MQRWSYWLPGVLLLLGLAACASSDNGRTSNAAVIRLPAATAEAAPKTDVGAQPIAADPAPSLPIGSPENCPITRPPAEPFTPPPSYLAQPPSPGQFWYGSEALWTMLRDDGTWQGLPYDNGEYGQKVVWWKHGYDWLTDQTPALTVSGRRLDGIAPLLTASRATNGYHEEFGSFMLVGVGIPTQGCWEITGQIDGNSLSFVVWVAP